MSRYWTEDELRLLRGAFLVYAGLDWDYAVEKAAHEGSVSVLLVDARAWSLIASKVGTRTPKQCANRMQTERMWSARKDDAQESAPLQLPLQTNPWGVDVSPYIGAPTGRIVWRHGEAV